MALDKKSLLNVMGVVYAHFKTADGGDIYLTRYAEHYQEIFELCNWYDKRWFHKHRVRLKGTGSVYRTQTRKVNGRALDLVVKNCRVGEDVPLDTHTLEEFCDAEFNSPWEEFSLVTEMRDSYYGPKGFKVHTQNPMAIYVPPEKMQVWQSGRSRSRINRIMARYPGIELDIMKQYILVYQWIDGFNLPEVFAHLGCSERDRIAHLKGLDAMVVSDLDRKGYLVADTKPEHIIISVSDLGNISGHNKIDEQVRHVYRLIQGGRYSVVDYELLLRTPDHEARVKATRRISYLDDQRDRFHPTGVPDHLSKMEILGVPYIYGHAESTGGHLWVVGHNARLFDYFLPERWRKTPSIRLSNKNEVFYTVTKDNIHLVWETSRVGELPYNDTDYSPLEKGPGIISPFEEFSVAHELLRAGVPCAYVRAIYMTGSTKIEKASDVRRFDSHKEMLDPEGNPILQKDHYYITIRGYYNGPDDWVARQSGKLHVPVDFEQALKKRMIDADCSMGLMETMQNTLRAAGFDGSLLRPSDLLLSINENKEIVRNEAGAPMVVLCNFKHVWKC